MNVYDFDGTLYRGDASLDFWRWCLRHHPATRRAFPRQLLAFALWCVGLWGRTRFKQAFFAFLRAVPNAETAADAFWAERIGRSAPWYPACRTVNDCVISASPTFLVRACPWLPPTCTVLGTEVNPATGRIAGKNCRGEEKVRRFRERFPGVAIARFYSDSHADAPLAALAREAFRVRNGIPRPWVAPGATERVLHTFASIRFLRFLLMGGINVATGVGFAWGFSRVLQANLAFGCGYLFSHALSYLLNARLTFHAPPTLHGYLRYCVAYVPNFTIQNLLVLFLHNLLGYPKGLTFLVSALLGVPITFLLLACYVFAVKTRVRDL